MTKPRWTYYQRSGQKERKYLIRFLSKDKLFKFLESGSIWFPRADSFGDKLECITVRDVKEGFLDYSQVQRRKRKHLISCWHMATNESVAMWDSYVSDPENRRIFALRFDLNELVDYVRNSQLTNEIQGLTKALIYGPVRYKNMLRQNPSVRKEDKLRYAAFRKEYSFTYENEYRFVVQLKNEFRMIGTRLHIGEPTYLNYEILVNPLLDEGEYEDAKKVIIKAGFANKLRDSSLAKWFKPNYEKS